MQLFFDTLHAQAITATTTSTQSIYSNDGTLTIVNPSGGTGPYTYTITTGPADPNITYPVNLPPGQSTFVNLPAGTYTIRITDALGNTTTITATVGGNYQFPSETFDTLSIPGIIATTIGGRSPYQYAISSTGANTGFGPYQTSNVFTHICPGAYWVRVRDSCQNIFTNRVTFKYSVLDSMVCINYSKGFFTTAAYGGHAPYTYHFGSSTNTTGIFTGLPPYFNGMLSWTDSCGVSDSTYIGPRQVHFFEICPFDSNIYVSGPEIAGPVLTMTCTDCTPVQTVLSSSLSPSSPSDLVFQHVAQNHNYHIVITTASCGGDTLLYSITPPSVIPFTIGSTALSCRSAQIIGSGTFDSVVLRNSAGVVIARNTTGTFMDIPDGSYSATAYVHTTPSACFIGSSASTIIHIPMFPSACEAMMKDSSCHTKWEFMVFTDPTMHDTYTLAYNGDTLNPITTPGNTDFFYNLNPGTYTLISDSGCSEPVVLDPFPSVTPTVVSYLPCVGLPSIMVTLGSVSGNMCLTNFSFSLFKADTLYNYTGNPDGSYGVTDSGWYQVREYISSTDANGDVFPYDLTCPLDTTPIFVSTSHLPTPSSNSAYICGTNNADTIFYHIYGGFIPYTVEIPGYDTSTLQTNTGIFPAHQAGQYSMIVYDNCGISRSVTFSVIDTCTACPVAAIASTDSVFCTGDTVHLKSTSGNAILYQWFINGTAYSISSDTIFIAGAGHYTVKLRVQSRSGCRDSILMHFDGGVSRTINLGPDSSYCSSVPFSIVLSTGYASSHWSTGQTGAQITVSAAAQYWVYDSSSCGVKRDTININSVSPYVINLGTDTSYCDTFTRVLSTGIASTHWSTGQTGPQITIDTVGIYWATATNICGTARDSIKFTKSQYFLNLGPDSTFCIGFTSILSTGVANTIWSTGQTGPQITIDTAGQYWATDSTICGIKRDTVNIFTVSPYVINLGADTSYCDSFTRVLSTGIVSTLWSTGQTGTQITADSVGLYWAMASNACGTVRDSIDLVINSFAVNLGPDSTFCIGFSTVLSTGVANTLWSTGQTGPQITIDTAGQYWATDSTICGVKSDTVNIFTVNPYSIDLGADTSYCTAFSRVLSTGIASTQWSTGQTGPQITVDSTGLYWAVATNICGTVRDSILISPSRYLIHLDADTSYCDTFSRILYTGLASTQWSTGQTGPQITVDSAGLYWATDSNICGLVVDTINISQHMIAGFALSTSKDTICIDQPDSAIVLATVDSSGPHVSFIWTGGQIDSAVYNSSLTAHTAGSYRVTVQEAECTLSKIAVIMGMACDTDTTCIHKIAIPNIFSPNSDNKNEEFKVLHTCPEDNFSLHIYNRWGQMVYESTDITKGWDGNYKGKQQAEEVYTWFVCIKSKSGGPDNCQTGTVTLVR